MSTKKKIYIAGPMSGYDFFNFPKFFAIQAKLEVEGWIVFNPANKDGEAGVVNHSSYTKGDWEALLKSGWSFRDAYTWDTARVIEADAIYMIKCWEKSPGAFGEHAVALAMKSKYPEYEIIYEN